ncbi:MAG: hypothetical protein M5U34_00950 [Chloroflexi bacterium]|nr:hypothetical protein [Chloroflexota bacterium]
MTGYLFIYNPIGIQQVTLADSTFQNLLTAEDEWLDWGADFAQNKKYLAYWVKTAQELNCGLLHYRNGNHSASWK